MNDASTTSPPETGRRALPRNVIALGFVSLLTDIATEAAYPLLPAYFKNVLKSGELSLGIAEGIAESIASLTKLASGSISDRMGRRKPFVLLGYGLAGAVRPLLGVCTTAWHVVAVRSVDRLGKGIRGAPRDALIAGSVDPRDRGRAFGFHRSMDHAGAAIGPLLASLYLWFVPGDYQGVFLWTAVPGAAVLLVLIFGVKEERSASTTPLPETPTTREPTATSLQSVANKTSYGRGFIPLIVAITLFALGNSSDLFLLARAEQLGLPTVWLPILWAAFSFAKSGCALWGGWLADRVSGCWLLTAGWALYAVVYASFGLVTSVAGLVGLMFVYVIFFGLTEPSERKLIADIVPANRRGAAFGWFHLAVGVAAAPASMLFGFIAERTVWGYPGAFGIGSMFALLAAFVVLVGVIPRRWTSLNRDRETSA